MNAIRRFVFGMFLTTVLQMSTGCARAPSFDILGSFFPAWLVCLLLAILPAVALRTLLNRYVEIAWPVLMYPSLTVTLAFVLWLVLFR